MRPALRTAPCLAAVPGAPTLRGVWGVAGGPVWAVGDGGAFVRVDTL